MSDNATFQRVPNGISVRKVIKAKDVCANETPFAKQQRLIVASFRIFAREFPDMAIKIVREETSIVLK